MGTPWARKRMAVKQKANGSTRARADLCRYRPAGANPYRLLRRKRGKKAPSQGASPEGSAPGVEPATGAPAGVRDCRCGTYNDDRYHSSLGRKNRREKELFSLSPEIFFFFLTFRSRVT